MAKDHAAASYSEVRYKKCAVEDEAWIKAFLRRAPFCALATVREGQPFINTNLFVYAEAEQVIYLHTARAGRTRANVEADGRACFSVSEMGRLLPADEALHFDVEYAGVTVFGSISIVEDRGEQRRALQMLLDKYAPHLRPGRDYRPITDEELSRTTVYRLRIEQWSGKKNVAEADFPGAFDYSGAAGNGLDLACR